METPYSKLSCSGRSHSEPSYLEASCPDLSRPEILSVKAGCEDPLEQLATEVQQQTFTTSRRLQESLGRRHQELLQGRIDDQYLVFTSVPSAESSRLSDDGTQISKYCRFFFNEDTRTLIAKIIPNPAHGLAIRSFDTLIMLELNAINVLDDMSPLGSSTVTIGDWKKEADCCWGPESQNGKLSFVVEVGLSQSSRQLALSARSWLETPLSSVNLVVTINVNQQSPEVILQRWELVRREYGIITRFNPLSARRTTYLRLSRINNTTSVAGEAYVNNTTIPITRLDLPFEKIVGRPPRKSEERDLVIREEQLRKFADKIWRLQGLV